MKFLSQPHGNDHHPPGISTTGTDLRKAPNHMAGWRKSAPDQDLHTKGRHTEADTAVSIKNHFILHLNAEYLSPHLSLDRDGRKHPINPAGKLRTLKVKL